MRLRSGGVMFGQGKIYIFMNKLAIYLKSQNVYQIEVLLKIC